MSSAFIELSGPYIVKKQAIPLKAFIRKRTPGVLTFFLKYSIKKLIVGNS